MTRKDYQIIADTFGRMLRTMPEADRASVLAVATELTVRFKQDNPGFKPARFLDVIEQRMEE